MRNIKKILLLTIFLFAIGCSDNEDSIDIATELIDVRATLLTFNYTADTGNNSSRLQYEVEFENENDIEVTGFYRITTNADGIVSSLLSSDDSPCHKIPANSKCIFSFDEEDSHNLGRVNSITFVSAEYRIEE